MAGVLLGACALSAALSPVWGVSAGTLAPTPGAKGRPHPRKSAARPKKPAASTSAEVVNLVKAALGPRAAGVTLGTLDLPGGKHAVTVSGAYDFRADRDAARAALPPAKALPAGWRLVDQLECREESPAYRYLSSHLDAPVNDGQVTGEGRLFDAHVEAAAGGKVVVYLAPVQASAPPPKERFERAAAAVHAVAPDAVVRDFTPLVAPLMRVYKLHFLRDSVPDAFGKNRGGDKPDISGIGTDLAATQIAQQLSSAYAKDAGLNVTPQENALILRGDPRQVQQVRQMLALYLDVPSPLVQADVLTIQVNSKDIASRQRAADKVDEIRAGVQIVRDLVAGSIQAMNKYVASEDASVQATLNANPSLKAGFARTGFVTSAARPLSLNEMLIFMALMDRGKLQKDIATNPQQRGMLTKALVDSLDRIQTLLTTDPKKLRVNPDFVHNHTPELARLIGRIRAGIEMAGANDPPAAPAGKGQYLLDRVGKLYDPGTQSADIAALTRFLEAWAACTQEFQKPGTVPGADTLSGELADASAHTDEDLKAAARALSADLQDLYFQPLMEWIREDVQKGSEAASGIDVIGTTRLLVRDRTLAETAGTAETFVPFTPIPRLTMETLTAAKTLANGTGTQTGQTVATDKDGKVVRNGEGSPVLLNNGQSVAFDPQTGKVLTDANNNPVVLTNPAATNPTTALGALNPLQALGVEALLQAQPDPVYRAIAPGTNLAIRPFVVPDGGAARVQLNLVTTIGGDNPTDAAHGGPQDRVTSHSVVTEANVGVFDLVEVASFGAQTSAIGDYRWRIPILDQIPLVGELFHGPRGRETHRQESIAIVNLTILPRSLDLVPYLKKEQ
jgi:hypothetical protein